MGKILNPAKIQLTAIKCSYVLIAILTILVCACKNDSKPQQKKITVAEAKEKLIRINKTLNTNDSTAIQNYLKEKKLDGFETSQTGLYHLVYGEANGKQVETGDIVKLVYTISLLDGTICYKSETDGIKEFKVGQGGVESGLEEGILLMKQGQKAKFIMPPHLAHGLIGDGKHIPARSIIVYDVELLEIVNTTHASGQ